MANEKRLIDANALMAEVKRTAEITKRRREQFSLRNLIMCIKNAPTVDAVEVVHGDWLYGVRYNYWTYDTGAGKSTKDKGVVEQPKFHRF